jgi:hypothetical protein
VVQSGETGGETAKCEIANSAKYLDLVEFSANTLLMLNIEYCKSLVAIAGLSITVEQYDSGQIGFIARPMIKGRRHNRSFSTSKYGTPENAAKAAINFCKEIEKGMHTERLDRRETYHIPETLLPDISYFVNKLIYLKVDPVRVLSEAAAAAFHKQFTQDS